MISDTHRRLREATQADHARLEARADILGQAAHPASRRRLVERFFGLHRDAEAGLAPWLAGLPGLDFEARRRSRSLARDLAIVGGAAPAAAPVALGGVGQALGLMYVLEGSTLGGQILRRQVLAAGSDMAGLSFLDPYGPATGARWRSFLTVLDAEARGPADADSMVEGAQAGFRLAERRLCEAPAHG